jgi:oxygen-independent coproporphyrinogen-3 oxidase
LKKLQEKAEAPKLGLYVHVPFCARSCDFCHFYQEPPRREDLDRYLAGMERALGGLDPGRSLESIFWGGGTPGLLPVRDLRRLGEAVRRVNGGKPPREWTVEMAPATVKPEKLAALSDLGVTRISMGVQTFQKPLLEALGRIHSQEQVYRAVEALHAADWENFNIDLIFAIPGQGLDAWEADLREALDCEPAHLSTYCLTFEEDTALWLRLQRGQVGRYSEEEEIAFFERAWDLLPGKGFRQYEVSNHAREGYTCIHNVNTWRMHEWIGVGPSASSQFGGRRWTEPHSLDEWLASLDADGPAAVEPDNLSPATLAEDYLIFGLRMNEGVDPAAWERRFPGSLPPGWPGLAARLQAEGLAEADGGRIRLTRRGRLLADRIGAVILEGN